MDKFDKIIGYESIKNELRLYCAILRDPDKYAAMGVDFPNGLILYGDPGLGKTLMSGCFIEESGLPAFRCRKNLPDGEFVKEIKATFEKAQSSAPAIVFLDDMDKFANGDDMHRNCEEYVTIQACIDECKGKRVFTLATANETDNLPDSLLRAGRFDKRIEVKTPIGEDSEKILAHYLSGKKNLAPDVDVKAIARILNGHSCAELETTINDAGMRAAFAGKDSIDMDSLVSSALRVVFDAPESEQDFSPDKLRRIAYHEAGHAIVGEILEPDTVTLVSVCSHDGDANGITSYCYDEDAWGTASHYETMIISALAGRAATETVLGELDLGATADLRKAREMILKQYKTYGKGGLYGLKRSYEGFGSYSEAYYENVVQASFNDYYLRAKKIIADNRALLDEVAKTLIEKKTILGSELSGIIKRVAA